MWCVPTIDETFITRMEDILELYAKPHNPKEPVLCFDEKSKQLLEDTRPVQQTRPGKPRRHDYEYKRGGTRNIFVAVEPQAGFRTTKVTARRTKKDTAQELARIIRMKRDQGAQTLHIVLDNLNTHFEQSFIETYGTEKAEQLLSNVQFHYTPKHASWLNMAEIEISILSRQCIRGRMPTETALRNNITHWQKRRNAQQATINWKFTKQDARNIFKYDRGSKLS